MQLFFYASPIIYPIGYLPPWAREIAFLNPFTQVLQDIRALLIYPEDVRTDHGDDGVRRLRRPDPDRDRVRHLRCSALSLQTRGAIVRGAGMSQAGEHGGRGRRRRKTFRLPHEQRTTFKEYFLHPFRPTSSEHQVALDDVTLLDRRGEFFGIVGPNGSGKSTLLKIVAGIYRQDAGSVRVNGRLSPFIELGVGFNPELTARDNVRINGTLLGLTRRQMADRFDEIVEFAELERFVDQKLKNFSSGMQVRLAYSIAIQVDFDILLLDEVLAVGDQEFQERCFETLARSARRARRSSSCHTIWGRSGSTAIARCCSWTAQWGGRQP